MDMVNVTCGEIQTPVGFLYVILPAILNHTNNPDCDQSWYLQLKHEIVFRGVFRASFSAVIQKTELVKIMVMLMPSVIFLLHNTLRKNQRKSGS
ncbi:hypothetical protein ROHU_014653 [Labeo rohita]|uniref:Uncharacterized protein n=1 Tax=Labeo rohita TaxID=84645 RepID=A0A498NSC7_LABRO|nr:hypothetical protein ROHU_014653 [Labeo rohita]